MAHPALLQNSRLRRHCPLTPLKSCYADDLGGIEGVEAVMRATRISAVWRSGPLAAMRSPKGLEAAHLGLNAAADVVSRPPFPERQP